VLRRLMSDEALRDDLRRRAREQADLLPGPGDVAAATLAVLEEAAR